LVRRTDGREVIVARIRCPKGHVLIAGGKANSNAGQRQRFSCPYCKGSYARKEWTLLELKHSKRSVGFKNDTEKI